MKPWRTDGVMRRRWIAGAVLLIAAVAVAWSEPGRAEPPSAASASFSPARLERAGDYLRNEVATGRIPGAILLVQQHGRPVYFENFGVRDTQSKLPMTADAIFRLYSMSKPITSVAAMMLVDGDFDNAQFAERLAKLPLAEQPGTRFDYGHSVDILGRVIEVVSGQSLYAFEKTRLLGPLGMTDTAFYIANPAKLPRLAELMPGDRRGEAIARHQFGEARELGRIRNVERGIGHAERTQQPRLLEGVQRLARYHLDDAAENVDRVAIVKPRARLFSQRQFREPFGELRVVEIAIDQHHRRNRRDRLRHRIEPKDGVGGHRQLALGVAHAKILEIDRTAVLLDQEDGAGNPAGRNLVAEIVAGALQPGGRKTGRRGGRRLGAAGLGPRNCDRGNQKYGPGDPAPAHHAVSSPWLHRSVS